MLPFFLLLTFHSFPQLCAAQSQNDTRKNSLSFQEALLLAQNLSLENKHSAIEISRFQLESSITDYALYPQLNVNSALQASKHASFTKDVKNAFEIKQPLYDFGRNSATSDTAEAKVKEKEFSAQEGAEMLKWHFAKAFEGTLYALDVMQTTEHQWKVAQRKADEQEQNYKRGLHSESDFVSAQVELSKAQIAFSQAKDVFHLAKLRLFQFLPSIPETTLNPRQNTHITPKDLQQKIDQWSIWEESPTQKKRKAEKEKLESEINRIEASKFPTLDMAFVASQSGILKNLHNNVSGQIQLNWSLPWSAQKNDEMEIVAMQKQEADVADAIEVKKRKDQESYALQQFALFSKQWYALSDQTGLLEKQQTLIKNRYDNGKASALEWTSSESDLIKNKLDLLSCTHQLLMTLLDLAEARSIQNINMLF